MSQAKRKKSSLRVTGYKSAGRSKGTFAGLTPKQRKRTTKKSGSGLMKGFGPSKSGR